MIFPFEMSSMVKFMTLSSLQAFFHYLFLPNMDMDISSLPTLYANGLLTILLHIAHALPRWFS